MQSIEKLLRDLARTLENHGKRIRKLESLPMGASSNSKIRSITYIFDGGGSAIAVNSQGDLDIPFACTITAWTLLADVSGAIVIDVWKDTYANYAPTDADSITGGAEPEIVASSNKAESTDLSAWTDTTIDAGDKLRFNVDSATSITRITLSLKVTVS